MNKDTQIKMTVVKKYHSLMNKKAGYANFVCVGFLPFRLIFSLDFERKLNTGCGKAPQTAFPNRQGVALPIFQWRAYKRSECVSHSKFGGSSKGATPALCLLAPLEKRKQ